MLARTDTAREQRRSMVAAIKAWRRGIAAPGVLTPEAMTAAVTAAMAPMVNMFGQLVERLAGPAMVAALTPIPRRPRAPPR